MGDARDRSSSLAYTSDTGRISYVSDGTRNISPPDVSTVHPSRDNVDEDDYTDDSNYTTSSTSLLRRSPHIKDSKSRSTDSVIISDRSSVVNDSETMSRDDASYHMAGLQDGGRSSESFFYRGKNEQLHRTGSWPLAEGNGWLPSNQNEESALCRPSITNYNTIPRDVTSKESEVTSKSKKDDAEDDSEKDEDDNKFRFSMLTRNQKVILASTSLTNLLSFWSLSILAPFFPKEADKKDVNTTISGWIFGVFALVQFLTSPLFGRILPVVGSKFMYLSGLLMCGGCTLCFGMLDQVDTSGGILTFVSMCFVTRIMLAIGCTAINNAGFVMLVRAFPNNVATVFGIGEIFTGLGMVTGPALGGFLYDAGGFLLPFAIIGVTCFVALPFIWLGLPPQDDSHDEESSDLSLWRVMVTPKSIVNSITVMVAASIWAVLDPTLEPHLRVYNLGSSIIGLMFLIMAAFYSVTSPLWGWLADKLPDNRALLIPGFLLAAVGLLLSGPSPVLGFQLSYNELWLTIISLVVLGVASAICVIPTYDIYIEVLSDVGYPEDTRTYGMVSGLWVSMYALGDFAGPSIGGFLDEEIGFEWLTTWFAASCVLTSILIAVTWYIEAKCCRKKTPEDTTGDTSGDVTSEDDVRAPILPDDPALSRDVDILWTYPPKPSNEYSETYP